MALEHCPILIVGKPVCKAKRKLNKQGVLSYGKQCWTWDVVYPVGPENSIWKVVADIIITLNHFQVKKKIWIHPFFQILGDFEHFFRRFWAFVDLFIGNVKSFPVLQGWRMPSQLQYSGGWHGAEADKLRRRPGRLCTRLTTYCESWQCFQDERFSNFSNSYIVEQLNQSKEKLNNISC